jgi:hypothetical protein
VFVVSRVGSSLYDKLINCAEKSYLVFVCVCVCVRARVCVCVFVFVCLIVCDLESSALRWPMPDLGCCATKKMHSHSLSWSR